jgi:hypothetical protein
MRIILFFIAFGGSASVNAQDSSSSVKTFAHHYLCPNQKIIAPAPDHAIQSHGFFCKKELELEKRKIPVRFRLGSTDYCNWLEKKPGYYDVPYRK